MRLGLMTALTALPAYIVVTDRDNIVKLLMVGALCLAGAFAGGHFLTVRARVPVMPNIRGPWLSELREDIVNATLVSILQNKGDLGTLRCGSRPARSGKHPCGIKGRGSDSQLTSPATKPPSDDRAGLCLPRAEKCSGAKGAYRG